MVEILTENDTVSGKQVFVAKVGYDLATNEYNCTIKTSVES